MVDFLEDLPMRLKIKTCKFVFKDAYNTIKFLKNGLDNFLTWIGPLLKPILINSD